MKNRKERISKYVYLRMEWDWKFTAFGDQKMQTPVVTLVPCPDVE
jgi:hypothetical protein